MRFDRPRVDWIRLVRDDDQVGSWKIARDPTFHVFRRADHARRILGEPGVASPPFPDVACAKRIIPGDAAVALLLPKLSAILEDVRFMKVHLRANQIIVVHRPIEGNGESIYEPT